MLIVFFEGNTGVSKPEVDPDQAEAAWSAVCRILFTQHRSETGLQKIGTTFIASSACSSWPPPYQL